MRGMHACACGITHYRDVLLGRLRLAHQRSILRRLAKQKKSGQQSTVVLQDIPKLPHALADIDAVKAATTARKEKRIFYAR
ncbi:hypothetical protein BDR06DRAFT_954762 [Suillus hirtellus]|nr:hypothetical protein BDR06DRAFT_954762 [Suillus hirtellus]